MIDAALLQGLVFRTSQGKQERGEDGRLKTRHFPVERPLTPDDIIAEKDMGDTVVIVTKDGRKHTIPRSQKTEGKGKEKKG